jgi:hypothetical protein
LPAGVCGKKNRIFSENIVKAIENLSMGKSA